MEAENAFIFFSQIPSHLNLDLALYNYFHIDKYSSHSLYHGQLLRGTFCTSHI